MTDPTDISAELPAPRKDEPERLRSDIVDELADHLNCAFQRELHSDVDSDPLSAETRVLARFGNPMKIARRLWWDAMQEKIMSQRIMTAALVVVAVAGVGMFLATWQTLGSVRMYLEDSQELNAVLVDKLESLSSAAPAAATDYDWCELRLKLVTDTSDGPPAAALTTTLQKLTGGGQTDLGKSYPFTTQQSDEGGLVDFSPVPYGSYYVTVQTEDGHFLKKEIVIRPGTDLDLTIVCPKDVPTGNTQLAVSLDGVTLPETIDGEVWTLCRIYQQNFFAWGSVVGTATDGAYGGTTLGDDRWLLWKYETVLVSPGGELFEVEWPVEEHEVSVGTDGTGGGLGGVWNTWRLSEMFSVPDELTAISELKLPIGQYTSDVELVVLQSVPEEGQSMTWRTLTEEERTNIAFEEVTEFVPNPFEVDTQSTAQWTVNVNAIQNLSVDGTIAVVARPQAETLYLGGFGGGGFGGGGFAGGGGGFF